MNETKTVWRWWWGWHPEKIENWLEEMEQDGWHLAKVDVNYLRFKFEKGESRKISYCVDYQLNVQENYFQLFKEDDWELVDDKNVPWFIWRKPYQDERPHIYTDTKSLIERNNRQMWTVGILLPVEIFIFCMVLMHGSAEIWVLAMLFLVILLLGYVTLQLYRHNKKLENNEIRSS